MAGESKAVFLSYASEDTPAALRIAEALKAAGIEVWFDKSELRGGDAWDQSIRRQIKNCALFIAILSNGAHQRAEGYFRLEWKLAIDRSHLISATKAFLVPVAIDDVQEDDEHIPDRFKEVQWTHLPDGATSREFVERVTALLASERSAASDMVGAAASRSNLGPMPDLRLLVVDGQGQAQVRALVLRLTRRAPGDPSISVHFRPVRADALFESAKVGARLAQRILVGEGLLREQLWVEFEVAGPQFNVTGRSADLALALAIVAAVWPNPRQELRIVGVTGRLDLNGQVHAVSHLTEKLAALGRSLEEGNRALALCPAERQVEVKPIGGYEGESCVEVYAVESLEEALAVLGYRLERTVLGNPFRGLEDFDYAHRTSFYGREREVAELVAQLLRREEARAPGLLVEAPSGSGKSSFLKAGVLAALIEPARAPEALRARLADRVIPESAANFVWRPSDIGAGASVAALVRSIQLRWRRTAELSHLGAVEESIEGLLAWRAAHWPAESRFVWIVDQLEELFAPEVAPEIAEAFGHLVLELQSQGAWTLACVRSDAIPRVQQIESLRRVFGANEGRYFLEPMQGPALEHCIRRPAVAAGLTFEVNAEGRTLDQQLIEEIRAEPQGLPLVQFALNELYARREGAVLTWRAYEALGGVSGCLARVAKPILEGESAVVSALLRALVRVDDDGHPSRRYATQEELQAEPGVDALAQRLVGARLCVRQRQDDQTIVFLAHEAILSVVPQIREWLRRESGLMQVREMAQRDAAQWEKHGRSRQWVAAADRLAAYRGLLDSGVTFKASVRDFIAESLARARRAAQLKRVAVGAIAALAVVASIAGVVATRNQHEAEQQTAEARRMQQKLAIQVAADRLKQGELSLARGIVLDVLSQRDKRQAVDPIAGNVFQEVRSQDSLLAVLPVHERESRRLRYSPDGRSVTVVPLSGAIQVWDADLGVKRLALGDYPDNGGPAEFSPDGRMILSGGPEIYLWDALTGQVIRHQKMPGGKPARAQFLPDGTRILLSYEAEDIVDARTFKVLRHVAVPGEELNCSRVSQDGTRALCHLENNDVGVLDLDTGRIRCRMHGHTDTVIAMQFSPDGRSVVTGGADTTVKIWDASTGRLLQTLENRVGQVWGAAFSPDGKQVLAAATDHSIRIWDLRSGTLTGSLKGHSGIAVEVEFSPSGDRLATLAYDGTVRIWKWGQDPPVITLQGDIRPTSDPSFSPDGALMVAPSSDKGARIWRVRDGNVIRAFRAPGGTITWAAYTKDATHILTASEDNKLQWWDSFNGALLKEIGAGGDEIASIGLSPDGQRAAVGHAGTWTLHDLATGAVLKTVSGHKEYVTTVMFSPDGRHLLTTCLDHTVAIWDIESGTQQLLMLQPDHTYGGDYSHDGARVLAGSEDHIVRIWDAHDGKLLLSLVGHPTRAYTGAFSPDDRWIATAGQDRTARVWDAGSGEQLAIYRGFPERVGTVNWSPDGRMLVPTTFAETVHFVRRGELAPLSEQIAWAQMANPDPLTREDKQNLGLESSAPPQRFSVALSSCEAQSGAPYDPARRAAGHERIDINPELATAACGRDKKAPELAGGRWEYLQGRALWAAGKIKEAQSQLDEAWRKAYAAAGVDAALLRIDQDHADVTRGSARSQLQQAWNRGVARAGTEMARLDGRNAEGETWLRKAQEAGDPSAFALEGEWEDQRPLVTRGDAEQLPHLLAGLKAYRQAVQLGEAAGWPEQTVRDWRFRRATLARLLAQRQQMHAAVQATASVTK